MQSRAFNSISIKAREGLLTKSSCNISKLKDEVNYYLNLPDKIAPYFPQLIDYKKDFSSYTVEYIPYKDLSGLILSEGLTPQTGKILLEQLFDILDDIHDHKPALSKHNLEIGQFYTKKTLERIQALTKDENLRPLVEANTLKINGKSYKTFSVFQDDFIESVQNFVSRYAYLTAIHGDFCFGNILYCPKTSQIKLIDPRGSFGNSGIYGHPFYDYAKLLHCLHGGYDQIVTNQYQLDDLGNNNFLFKKSQNHLLTSLHQTFRELLCERGMELEFLYLIEASLFLSMTTLHYEDPQRQKALFLNGIIILNEYFEEKYKNLY
ncbi:MAG: aminoglycoside phosphotransferase family protein [Janthinobacterium lividum]